MNDVTDAMIEARILLEREPSLARFRQLIPLDNMELVNDALTVAFFLGFVKYGDDLSSAIRQVEAERIAKLGH